MIAEHLIGTQQELQMVLQWLRVHGVVPGTGRLSNDWEVIVVDGWQLYRLVELAEGRMAMAFARPFQIAIDPVVGNCSWMPILQVAPWLVETIVANLSRSR